MSADKANLRALHTFSLPVFANRVVFAESVEILIQSWQEANARDLPFLLLGEGSNVLFLNDFNGAVVFNRLKGIEINETAQDWLVHVGAGENWHQLVITLLGNGIYGLENLALIPGCVGSAPIQNIGAYGVELKDYCDYVDLLDLTTGKIRRIESVDCVFGYRDSIFKHQYREGYAIIAVGFKFSKNWSPVLNYGDLKKFNLSDVTAKQVFDCVCDMRRSRLPDPKISGNAGSFFKNPVIANSLAHSLLAQYPDMPVYPHNDYQMKIAAGWLIDQCELKGYQIGGAMVHKSQALVIINYDNAISQDIADLAYFVRQCVAKKFNIYLEPEVRFIDEFGEVDAVEYLM